MHASATDAYLSECRGPWPKISVTCPAIIHLIQLRYPDMIDNLLPIETARELAAKLLRRRLVAEKGLGPGDIGIFFITPCSAMLQSIHHPEALEASYLDGAFSIAEVYGPLLGAIKANGPVENPPPISERGLLWAMAGGEIAGLRNANTITVAGVRDVLRVFDHIEEGKLQAVDFFEAYICPDGCISGQLTVENRYAARRTVQQVVRRHGQRAHRTGLQVLLQVEEVLPQHRAHLLLGHRRPFARPLAVPAHDLLHGAPGGVTVLHRELPADAAVRADVGLDEVDGLELALLDVVEDPQHVAHPGHGDGVGVAQARDLPARHRPEQPALADGRGVLHRPVRLDRPEQRTVDLGDGEGPVQVRRLQGLRVVDGLQHRAAGSDEENAD